MLTRLEVDGFKNLLGFVAEFGPFTCIAGANAVGKSNLFDAIEFLSLLADHSPDEAAQRLRGGSEEGDARDLFWRSPGQRAGSMRIAAEMILPTQVQDDYLVNKLMRIPSNFLRYELQLQYEEARGNDLIGRVYVTYEDIRVIRPEVSSTRLKFSDAPDDLVEFAQGTPEVIATGVMRRTSTSLSRPDSSQFPWLPAIRRELQSWRRLALEPAAMRKSDSFKAPPKLDIDGSHLAAMLYRITHQEGTDPVDAYAELASRLSELTPVRDVRIDRDDKREILTLEAQLHHVGWLPARALSEGTLRFLALASLALDPEAPRLACIEEPENGIHPAVVGPLAELLRSTAGAPERQIIINTHSPVFVRQVHQCAPEDLLTANLVGMMGPDGTPTRALRLEPLVDTWRCHGDIRGVGLAALIDYLESPRHGD